MIAVFFVPESCLEHGPYGGTSRRLLGRTSSISDYVEFHREVGRLLREYKDDRVAPTDVLWQIRRLYDELRNANGGLEGVGSGEPRRTSMA